MKLDMMSWYFEEWIAGQGRQIILSRNVIIRKVFLKNLFEVFAERSLGISEKIEL